MENIEFYQVVNGYEIIGFAKDLDECIKVCDNYCRKQAKDKINFKRKRVIDSFSNDGEEEYAIIYQYNTLYLEMFYCTKKLRL